MRGGVLALALTLAAAMAACGSTTASTTGGAATRARTCGPPLARTLAASPQARVYADGAGVYGCSAVTHRITRLGQRQRCIGSSRAGPAAVAGQLAAYGLQSCGVDTGTAQVVLRRLSDGPVRRTLSATVGPRRPESYESVTSIVVRPDGAVAWIGRLSSIISHRSEVQVLAAEAGRAAQVLDSGPGIGSGSLTLRGSRLSWKDGGRNRSATLG